jgi:hypothetical protein
MAQSMWRSLSGKCAYVIMTLTLADKTDATRDPLRTEATLSDGVDLYGSSSNIRNCR